MWSVCTPCGLAERAQGGAARRGHRQAGTAAGRQCSGRRPAPERGCHARVHHRPKTCRDGVGARPVRIAGLPYLRAAPIHQERQRSRVWRQMRASPWSVWTDSQQEREGKRVDGGHQCSDYPGAPPCQECGQLAAQMPALCCAGARQRSSSPSRAARQPQAGRRRAASAAAVPALHSQAEVGEHKGQGEAPRQPAHVEHSEHQEHLGLGVVVVMVVGGGCLGGWPSGG